MRRSVWTRFVPFACAGLVVIAAGSAPRAAEPFAGLDIRGLSLAGAGGCLVPSRPRGAPAAPLTAPGARGLSRSLRARSTADEVVTEDAAQAAALEIQPDVSTTQTVFLDFDGGSPTYTVTIVGLTGAEQVLGVLPSHVYSAAEREQIESMIAADLALFDIEVTRERPAAGEFSTLTFNGDFPIRLLPTLFGGFLVDTLLGRSDNVDRGNRDRSDNAAISANLWEFYLATDASGQSFLRASGLSVDAAHPLSVRLSEAIVRQSANTAAHELGHLLGLRHHDAFGAPGDGLPSNGTPDPRAFVPVYAGPERATETQLHLMGTGDVGAGASVRASVDEFYSERDAVKLALNERASSTEEEARALGGWMELGELRVPNPVLQGRNADAAELAVRALGLRGRISEVGEVDEYEFDAEAGSVWTADLSSWSDLNTTEPVITWDPLESTCRHASLSIL